MAVVEHRVPAPGRVAGSSQPCAGSRCRPRSRVRLGPALRGHRIPDAQRAAAAARLRSGVRAATSPDTDLACGRGRVSRRQESAPARRLPPRLDPDRQPRHPSDLFDGSHYRTVVSSVTPPRLASPVELFGGTDRFDCGCRVRRGHSSGRLDGASNHCPRGRARFRARAFG